MTASKALAIIATILLGVGFVLVAFTHGVQAKTVQEFLFAGLTAFAAAHCL